MASTTPQLIVRQEIDGFFARNVNQKRNEMQENAWQAMNRKMSLCHRIPSSFVYIQHALM
jgi:hypothetical protein